MEIHREMGPGFLEAVYHEYLEIEFQIRNIPYISKPGLKLYYKNKQLEKYIQAWLFSLFRNNGRNKSREMLNKNWWSTNN